MSQGQDMRSASFGQGDDDRRYALSLVNRVRSFETDPLHSSAYLTYLAKFLKSPFYKQSRRPQPDLLLQVSRRQCFIQQYTIRSSEKPELRAFDDHKLYTASPSPAGKEVVFLTGRPSAEWLNAVGSRYQLDHRFFHQHLCPLIANQRHWYSVPTLPSRSLEVIRLCIPSIVFIGSEGRDVDVRGLELARNDCNDQLRRLLRSMQDSTLSEAGKSIIRRMHIHNGSALVVEQEVTITLIRREEQWTLLVWTDAGSETGHEHIPVPSTEGFSTVSSELAFCPVFFENELIERGTQGNADTTFPASPSKQPLTLLSSNYGATIDWVGCSDPSPLFVLQELLAFETASALQYINMLEQVLSDHLGGSKFPSYEHTKLETILHFDYATIVLTRLRQHFTEVSTSLSKPSLRGRSAQASADSDDQSDLLSSLQYDLRYLVSRTERLLSICDAGKSTMMSNASIQDSRRSAAESKLVSQLTKATSRITFIFFPISYVNAVFGMNFVQFGQGKLSIWIWVVITVPLLIISVILVERGDWITNRLSRKKQ